MKLARLLLQAFGPFTNTVLDFAGGDDEPAANLHLIYGRNEAGKSSALRAMTDLRFGIPLYSADAFIHEFGDLRVAGLFIDAAGEPVGLVRRKGRGQTLSRFDVATGQSNPELVVQREHELALTGGLERAEFESMFGLNHERLREGGGQLLRGEGELGSALFEASAGTSGIGALLAALDTDAKKLFNPHGRAQNAVINEARAQLDEQRRALREAQIKPAAWQTLNRAHETAKAALDEVTLSLETLRRRENELTELRTVEPLLREHDRLAAKLEPLTEIPDLAADAREQRVATEKALLRAQKDLQECEVELARCAAVFDALVLEPLVLEHGDAIERLVGRIEAAARTRIEVQQQRILIARIESELVVRAARIAPGRPPLEIALATPSDADRVALDGHLRDASRLGERLDVQRKRAEELDDALKPAAESLPELPDPAAKQALVTALRQAQSLGDVARQLADIERQIHSLEAELVQGLSDMRSESETTLRKAQPLLDAEIASTRQELAEFDEMLLKVRDEDQRLQHALQEQRLRQRELAAEGEVVTAETLRVARERRDEGWALIRRAYVERSQEGDELARGFDADRELPEAFEAAKSEADRQADLLRLDARRAANSEVCSTRIEQMEARCREIEGEVTALTASSGDTCAAWVKKLSRASLPGLEPEELREWQAKRQAALQVAERLATVRADRDLALNEAAGAASGIATGLRTVAHPAAGESADDAGALTALIAHAARWETLATQAEAEHGARIRADRAQRIERDKLGRSIAEADAELQSHMQSLQIWHARLFLPADCAPDVVKARLDELDGLARQAATLSDAQQRQAQHQSLVDDLASQASQLARLLNEPVPEAVDDFADRLRKRLGASRKSEQERDTLMRDQVRAQEKKRQAEVERVSQAAIQTQLCAAAGVEAIDRLSDIEEAAARKRETRRDLAMLRQQLASASAQSEDDLRVSLADLDAIAIHTEREKCRADITHRETEQSSAREAEESTRRALEEIDSSDRAATAREAMESAAARYRAAIRPWARLRLAHSLLAETLNRFRERAQAPIVAAASNYFSLITHGGYTRLVADEADGKPVLRAERSNGERIGVEAMSDGTSDQLYLALRLAALELRRASHPQMPLVLDDVLVTSDDERSANILRALARFAEGGQVMLFTHHRHLIDVARTAVGSTPIAFHYL